MMALFSIIARRLYMPTFSVDTGGVLVHLSAFDHADGDFTFDPLSSNRRFPSVADLPVLGTVVVAGPIRDSIEVMVPDCLVPPVGREVHFDLLQVVTLRLGPAADMGRDLPPLDLDRAAPTPSHLHWDCRDGPIGRR